jgi:hypothetical protein
MSGIEMRLQFAVVRFSELNFGHGANLAAEN